MKIRLSPFNIYLLLALAVLGLACKTTEERKLSKQASTLRVYLARLSERGSGVAVYRQNPVHFNVEHEPIVTETDLETAEVIDQPGGFAIKARFNGHGALLLEQATVAHHSEHLAIQSFFGESRWLAAPQIKRRISNGELVFTPDATREEADRIVRGLTNVVNKVKSRDSGF
jgi:hypothetical protein